MSFEDEQRLDGGVSSAVSGHGLFLCFVRLIAFFKY